MKKILVSTCLFGGPPVRYDGKDKHLEHPLFLKWKKEGRLIPVCPEVFGGLPIPRPAGERAGDKVMTKAGGDITAEYTGGAKEAVRLAKENDVAFCIMKQKSPSCGSKMVYDGSFSGRLVAGEGVAVEMLRKEGFVVFGEEELEEAEKLLAETESSFDGR